MASPPYQRLIGGQVLACEIVEDYLHIRMNVAVVNIANPIRGLEISPEGCARVVGHRIVDVRVAEGDCITFMFDGQVNLVVSLKPEDYVGPEALEIGFPTGGNIVL